MASAALAHRGRLVGTLLMLLGGWGALVPFVGPYLHYAYTPDRAWTYTSGRLWLSVLPGAAAFLGGLLVVGSDRAASLGAFVAAAAGTWFIVGQQVTAFAVTGTPISAGRPAAIPHAIAGVKTMRFLETLGFYYGLGVVIVFFAALALGEVLVAKMAARRFSARLAQAAAYRTTDQYPAGQYPVR